MARMNDKAAKWAPFTCQLCGETKMLPFSFGRKYCPDCSITANRMATREWTRTNPKPKKKKKKKEVRQKTDDELFDERILQQYRLQCKSCRWWSKGEHNTPFGAHCGYYLYHGVGHRVDHGNGPGDCRCFEPRRKRAKSERVAYSSEQLRRAEAENHAMKVGE